jgi:phosphoribosylformimino-5-aminoimidazole carboxamide ribotide isomerase
MIIIPAIDLRGGRVVRLEQGDFDRETRYPEDPLALAERYQEAGATSLHLVDLDSARAGGDANLDIIARICRSLDIPVQTGGGVRSLEDVEKRLEAGAARVVIGSLCVTDPERLINWLESLGPERLVAGLDVMRGLDGTWIPRASGWTKTGDFDLFTLLDRFVNAGLKHLLCTDIERDGMYSGPALALYQALVEQHPSLKIQASGGVGSSDDLEAVARTGVAGCIVGRALLEARVRLKEIERWSR